MERYVDGDVRRIQYGRKGRGRKGITIEIRKDQRNCAREELARDVRDDNRGTSVTEHRRRQ